MISPMIRSLSTLGTAWPVLAPFGLLIADLPTIRWKLEFVMLPKIQDPMTQGESRASTMLRAWHTSQLYEVNIHPHFTDEETEARTGKATYPKLHSQEVAEPGAGPRSVSFHSSFHHARD